MRIARIAGIAAAYLVGCTAPVVSSGSPSDPGSATDQAESSPAASSTSPSAPSTPAAPGASAPSSAGVGGEAPSSAAPGGPAPASGDQLSFSTATRSVSLDANTSVDVDVYAPDATGRYPLVVLRHGLTRSKENLAGYGKQLAPRGYLVVVPNSRAAFTDDPDGDAKDILAVTSWALAEPSFAAKIDPTRIVLGGHSSGGLAAVVAAARAPSLRALLLLDTEGHDSRGPASAASITAPALAIYGEPNMICNESGDGVSTFQALAGPRFGFRIQGASHCAAESPSGPGCELICGSVSPDSQAIYLQSVTSFLDAYVACNPASFAALDPQAPSPAGVQSFTSDDRGSPADFCARAATGG